MKFIRSLTTSATGGQPVLIVLPSTEAAIKEALQYAKLYEIALIGEERLVPSAMRPASYLANCKQACNAGRRPVSALIFTDQFVDAPESSLPVGTGELVEYVSSTELLALSNYGLRLEIWTNQGFRPFVGDAAAALDGVVLALQAYYNSCDKLGTEWLVRARQGRRRRELRRTNAVHRIREYESALMQHLGGAPIPHIAHSLLQRLGALRAEVLRSRKEMDA